MIRYRLPALGGIGLLLCLGAGLNSEAHAGRSSLYRYVDDSGQPVLVDDLAKVPVRFRGTAEEVSPARRRSGQKRETRAAPQETVAPAASSNRMREWHSYRTSAPGWVRTAIGLGLATLFFAFLLWLAVKIVDPQKAENTMAAALFIGLLFAIGVQFLSGLHLAFLALPLAVLLYVLLSFYGLGLVRSVIVVAAMAGGQFLLFRFLPTVVQKIVTAIG